MSDTKPGLSGARSRKFRTLFARVISGQEGVTSNNETLFLEAVCDQKDRSLCIQRLAGSLHGFTALQSALASDKSATFLKGSITAFLRYLGAPRLRTLCGGDILRQIILKFVEVELIWEAFIAAFRSDELTIEGDIAFSWLLCELVSLPREKTLPFTSLALEEKARKRLLESPSQEIRLRGQRIVHIEENLAAKHQNPLDGPDGRHDNDFAEIRTIEILPTSDELASKDPCLPRAQETNERGYLSEGLAFHLDAHVAGFAR